MSKFKDALYDHAEALIRIGKANPSRMDEILANLRRLGNEWADELAFQDVRQMQTELRQTFSAFCAGGYKRELPTIKPYRIDRIKPILRAELDRRIASSASLIKINRQNMIAESIQRFAGWSTGDIASQVTPPREVVTSDKKASDFTVRRVRIDQRQKLRANIADITAKETGAIAFYWRGKMDDRERPLHKKRNGKLYLLTDTWATKQGLVKASNDAPWAEFSESKDDGPPGVPIYCRCHAEYVFDLDELPPSALTEKGRAKIDD